MKLGVIDYGAGNLRSVCNSFHSIGAEASMVCTPEDMEGLTHLVLPGVGAFGDCASKLVAQGLTASIRQWIDADKPFLGICVGYQVLFEEGEENPGVSGLGIFRGKVVRFSSMGLKIPHMGWNNLNLKDKSDSVWKGMGDDPFFYFVHSFFPIPEERDMVAATCTYGEEFAAAIRRGRLLATQFHPEKSQKTGMALLKNFISL